jgi:hypothetical protein
MLTCWRVHQGKLVMVAQASELQLMSSYENEQIFSHNIGRNNKIVRVMAVNESTHQKSSIMLVLMNGIRLYVSLEEGLFQIDSYEYPPSFEPHKHKR